MNKYTGCLLVLACSQTADAHFYMTFPTPRYTDQLFTAPCGRDPETGRDHVTTLHSGSQVVVTWVETITNSPSYFRLSFDDDGQDGFERGCRAPLRTGRTRNKHGAEGRQGAK